MTLLVLLAFVYCWRQNIFISVKCMTDGLLIVFPNISSSFEDVSIRHKVVINVSLVDRFLKLLYPSLASSISTLCCLCIGVGNFLYLCYSQSFHSGKWCCCTISHFHKRRHWDFGKLTNMKFNIWKTQILKLGLFLLDWAMRFWRVNQLKFNTIH